MPVEGLPEIVQGENLADIVWSHLPSPLQNGDIIVVTHKAVSKSQGHVVSLDSVVPSPLACSFAQQHNKRPEHVEVVLQQSQDIVRMQQGLIISRTKHGFVCANAGVDCSNASNSNSVCLLPDDPDASAAAISLELSTLAGFTVPVLISDSFGRPWRLGIVNVAIGLSGMNCFTDYRGQTDPAGRDLKATIMASADAIAAGAELVMGKLDRIPAVLVRGFSWQPGNQGAKALIMPEERNLFR